MCSETPKVDPNYKKIIIRFEIRPHGITNIRRWKDVGPRTGSQSQVYPRPFNTNAGQMGRGFYRCRKVGHPGLGNLRPGLVVRRSQQKTKAQSFGQEIRAHAPRSTKTVADRRAEVLRSASPSPDETISCGVSTPITVPRKPFTTFGKGESHRMKKVIAPRVTWDTVNGRGDKCKRDYRPLSDSPD